MATLIITCECTTLLKLLPLLFTTNSNTFCWFKKKVSSIDGKHLLILWLESNSVCVCVCVCVWESECDDGQFLCGTPTRTPCLTPASVGVSVLYICIYSLIVPCLLLGSGPL